VAATREVTAYNGNNILNIRAKSNRKFNLVIIKIPAVTIVAACINAETGVNHRIWQPSI
jgi:hypothetical protein